MLFRLGKFAFSKVVGKFFLVLNRRLIGFVVVGYYFFQANQQAFATGNVRRILLGMGRSLASADQAVGTQAMMIVNQNLTGLAFGSALLTLISALTTLVVFFRFGVLVIQRIEPNAGILLRWGVPLLFYSALVWVVSGGQRLPFEGLWFLFENLGGVFDVSRLWDVGGGVVNRSAGNVTG